MGLIQANPFNRNNLIGETLEGWQSMLNLAAELIGVPAGLITRLDGGEIEVFLSSKSEGNPYPEGAKTHFPDSGFYCEWVVKNRSPMMIPNALLDPMWKENGAAKMGMIAYFGMPIMRPDGNVFGSICFIDSKENSHNQTIIKLVDQFKRMIELSLKAISAGEEVKRRDRLFNDLATIFPICAYCKKVKNEKDSWVPVENYIKGISGHRATHAICPSCYEQELAKDATVQAR